MAEVTKDKSDNDITVCTSSSLKQTFSKKKDQAKCLKKSFYRSSKIVKVNDEVGFKSEKIQETIKNSDLDESCSDLETKFQFSPKDYHKSMIALATKRYFMKKELERINSFMRKVNTDKDRQSSSKEKTKDGSRSSDTSSHQKKKPADLNEEGDVSKQEPNLVGEKTKKILNCRLCDYQSFNPRSYKRHIIRHNTSKTFACQKCPMIFLRRCKVIQHMKIHSPKGFFSDEKKAKVSPKRKRNLFK